MAPKTADQVYEDAEKPLPIEYLHHLDVRAAMLVKNHRVKHLGPDSGITALQVVDRDGHPLGEKIIHCPTIGEVSYPGVLKGISVQYGPGKKKKAGRKPKRFEAQLMSLREVPLRLDNSAELLRERLITVLDNPDAMRSVIAETMGAMARYGGEEVRKEFIRQRVTVLGARTPLPDLDAWVSGVADDLQDDLRRAFAVVQKRLSRTSLSGNKRVQWTAELLERKIAPILTHASNRTVNEGFGRGRRLELRAILLRPDVAEQIIHLANPHRDEGGRFTTKKGEAYPVDLSQITVVQTAVNDNSLCDECAAVDGETFEYGSDRMDELTPPFVKCLGGDNCRCSQIAIVGGEEVDVAEVTDQELEDLLQEG